MAKPPSRQSNRIPFEDVENMVSYELPSLGEGRVVPSVKRKDKEKQKQEHIEELDNQAITPLTAESLQQLTEAAEQEAREQGYNEGFEAGETKGRAQGEQKAYAEAKTKIEEKLSRLEMLADALLDPVQMQDNALENTILDMAVQLTKHLIQRELTQDPSCLFSTVQSVVSSLPVGNKAVRIYVNEDDHELLSEAFETSGKNWTFYTDKKLSRGGCRVETEHSIADYAIETRINTLLEEAAFSGEIEEDDYETPDYSQKGNTKTEPDFMEPDLLESDLLESDSEEHKDQGETPLSESETTLKNIPEFDDDSDELE